MARDVRSFLDLEADIDRNEPEEEEENELEPGKKVDQVYDQILKPSPDDFINDGEIIEGLGPSNIYSQRRWDDDEEEEEEEEERGDEQGVWRPNPLSSAQRRYQDLDEAYELHDWGFPDDVSLQAILRPLEHPLWRVACRVCCPMMYELDLY
jgi:hypothetical protein